MKKRKGKQRKFTLQLTTILLLLLGFVVWYMTDSIKAAAVSVGVGIGACITFQIIYSIRAGLRLLQSGITDIDKMSGVEFEKYLKLLFTSKGYGVSLTPGSGDYGADLILKKEKDVIVVQAKRYRTPVGIKAVQEVIPAINMYKATAAWVITNSVFTRQALLLAKSNNVRMIDRKELISLILEAKRGREAKKV